MALFDGLLGGGSADPYDLYGDILTAKQREALRARSSDQTWANAANFLSKAAMPTNRKIPLGGLLAGLAGAMGGSNQDEAVQTALKGSLTVAQIAELKRKAKLLEELGPIQKRLWEKQLAQYGGGGAPPPVGAPAAPGAPATPSAVPAGARPPVPVGGVPGAYGAAGEYGVGQGLPAIGPTSAIPAATQMAGLLGGGPTEGIDALGGGNDILSVIAALSQGGGGGSGAPFDLASMASGQGQGLPDVGPVRVEALSGEARPAAGDRSDAAWEYYKPIIKRLESGNRNIEQQVVPRGGGYNPSTGTVTPWSSASSPLQMLDSTFQNTARKAGIDVSQYPRAMNAPEAVQDEVGKALFKERGLQPWAAYNAPLARETGYTGPMANRGGSGFSGRIEPLGGEAAPAGRSGLIPGLGITPEALATLNSMYEAAGVDAPFKSLLDTYYKSPGYLEEKTRVETQARKDVEAKEDPLIEAQKTRQRLLVEEEIKPRLEAAIEKAKSPVLQEREAALAVIARETKRLEIAGQAAVSIQDIDIIGDDGKTSSTKLPALEIARRNADAAGRRALGDLTPRPGDIATRPVLSPEETARQTQRGKTQEETREVDVWTPAGPVKQTLTNAEIDRRRASRAAGGAPQVGDIIDKPVMTPADTKISESFGERFIKMRDRAEAAEETITDTHNLRRKLDSGIFTGLDANFNLFMSKLGDTVGYKNLAEPDKIRNTEVFVAGIAKDVLAMAKELKPVSNTDLVFLDRMAGGVNMSAGAIRELLDMRERYARLAITRHNAEAGRKHPDTFKGTRQYIDMPPDYQIQESTTPSGNRVIINR